jgi:hypothetical protein
MLNGEPFSVVLKYYLVAVVIHATWNLAAVYSLLFGSETGAFLIFLFSIILAISGLQLAKKRIAVLDGIATIPVNESLPPAGSSWDGDSKWNRESKWDSKESASQADALYSTETTGTVGSDWDWKSTLGTIIFLLFIAFNILETIL